MNDDRSHHEPVGDDEHDLQLDVSTPRLPLITGGGMHDDQEESTGQLLGDVLDLVGQAIEHLTPDYIEERLRQVMSSVAWPTGGRQPATGPRTKPDEEAESGPRGKERPETGGFTSLGGAGDPSVVGQPSASALADEMSGPQVKDQGAVGMSEAARAEADQIIADARRQAARIPAAAHQQTGSEQGGDLSERLSVRISEPVTAAPPSAGVGLVQSRRVSRLADSVVETSGSLVVPGLDLRVMGSGDREAIRARVAGLRDRLSAVPAGALGAEATAVVLGEVAALAEILTVDRDAHTAIDLTDAAYPHLVFLGRRHPAGFGVRRARADAQSELGWYRWAEVMLRRLGADERREFGSTDPRTILLLNWSLGGQGRWREAASGLQSLKDSASGGQGPDLQHVLCRLAWLLGRQGRIGEAVSGYDGVIVNRSHELGDLHPDTGDARHSKGKLLVLAGEGSSAVGLLTDVADERGRIQGDDHPDTLESRKYLELANVLAMPGDGRVVDRTIRRLQWILRIQVKRLGPGHPMSRDTMAWLRRLNETRKAIRFREPLPDLLPLPVQASRQDQPGSVQPDPGTGASAGTAADRRPRRGRHSGPCRQPSVSLAGPTSMPMLMKL